MKITELDTYIMIGYSSIMILLYLIILAHTYLGNRNTWLTWVIILLLISCVGTLINAYSFVQLFMRLQKTNLNCLLAGIGGFLALIGFNLSHFYLADKY